MLCSDGLDRTAYVMCTQNMSHEEAFQYVQARRFCVSPNQGFQHQIEAYQHIYEAARTTAADPNANRRGDNVRRKRTESDDEEAEDGGMSSAQANGMVGSDGDVDMDRPCVPSLFALSVDRA